VRDDLLHLARHRTDELLDDDGQRLARVAHLTLHERAVETRRRPDQQVEHHLDARA